MAYQDGTFTNAVQNGPAQIFYPFINAATKDNVTKGTIRNYVVLPSSYTPAAALSTDPADNTQYLITESDLTIEGGVARFSRTYSKVPQQQIEPGTIVLSKPTIPGNDAFPRNFGSYLIVQPDTTLESYDAYRRANVTSDTGVPGFYPTGGTYSLSFEGNTTSAISYSANAATVQSAINGLTTVQNRGNVVVSGSYNSTTGFGVVFNNYATGTINSTSVTATDGTVTSSVASSNNGYTQSFEMRYNAGTASDPAGSQNVSNITYTGTVPYQQVDWPYGGNAKVIVALIQTDIYPNSYMTGGSFTISLYGETSSPINVAFTTQDLQSNASNAINAMTAIKNRGGASVTADVASNVRQQYRITLNQTGSISGGTFIVSLFSENSAAIAYNANVATIQSSLNALNNVQLRGNVIVSSSGSGSILNNTNTVASFSVGFSNNALTSNSANLTPAGSTISISKSDFTIGRTQNVTMASGTATRTVYAAGHQIDAGETIFLRNAASVFANIAPSKVSVIDSNTIQLSVSSSDTWANIPLISEIGPRTKEGYEPGSVVIRSKTTTDFYLPGVTSGITTADDIPIPVDESGTAAFLQAAFSGQDNINVRVGELRPWQGPILMVDRTSVNADDV